MDLRLLLPLAAAATAACTSIVYVVPPEAPPVSEEERADNPVASDYLQTVGRVRDMIFDSDLQERVSRRGLGLMNVNWEDTGRAQGSVLGPNISDLTLQVRHARGGARLP